MRESKNQLPHNSRELMLEWQVKILADRLAIAVSLLEDYELNAFCDGEEGETELWEELQKWLVGPEDEGWRYRRSEWRKGTAYQRAAGTVRGLVRNKIRESRLRSRCSTDSKQHAAVP